MAEADAEPNAVTLGPIHVDRLGKRLMRGEVRLDADAQQVDVLLALIRAYPAIVSKDTLIQEVWGGRFVTDAALHKTISELRKVLREACDGQEWIETRHRRGYQLAAAPGTAPVRHAETPSPHAAPEPSAAARPASRRWPLLMAAGGVVAVLAWVGAGWFDAKTTTRTASVPTSASPTAKPKPAELPHVAAEVQARIEAMSAAALVQTIRDALGQDEALARAAIAELGDPRLADEMPDHRALADKFAGIDAYRSGDFDQAMGHYRRALDGFVQSGNRAEEGNVLNNMGVLHSESGRDPDQAAAWFQRSREIREALNDKAAVLASHKNLANLWLGNARFDRAQEAVSAYVAAARETGTPADQIDALLLQGDVALGLGEANAATWFEQAHELAVRAGDALLAASAQQRLGRLALRAGRPAEARDRFAAALTLYEQSPDSHQRAIVLYNLANADEALGDAPGALAHYQNAEAEAPDPHSTLAVDAALGQVRMLWRLDRFPDGEALLSQVNQRVLTQGESLTKAVVNVHRSSLALMQDQPLAARALIQEARKILGEGGDWELLVTLQEQEIWVHMALAEHDGAQAALERLRDQAKARGDQRVLDRYRQLEQLAQVARGATVDAYRTSILDGSGH